MERKVIITADGSATIYLPQWEEHYHSKHGALQEALHVFIQAGLDHRLKSPYIRPLQILEMGFGTGLNALITYNEAAKRSLSVDYTGIEAYPVSEDEAKALKYPDLFAEELGAVFQSLHQAPQEEQVVISDFFRLKKKQLFFDQVQDRAAFDLIYFDAFGPRVQPELWTEEIFRAMFEALREDGILVTYSAKGSVRRNLQTVGFEVERLPGPPGKREMLRGTKLSC